MTVTPRTSTNCTRHSDTTPGHTVPALRAFTTARCRSPTGSPASAMPVRYPDGEDIATPAAMPGLLFQGVQQFLAGLLAASACLFADPAVLVVRMPPALIAAALADS